MTAVETPPIPLWTRPITEPVSRVAHVLFIAFAEGPLAADVPLSLVKYGVPTRDHLAHVAVGEHSGEESREWIDGWRTGALRDVAVQDLGPAVAKLDAADRCFTVDAKLEDPSDLGYLQTAWALVRWLAERGASVVLDAHAGRFLTTGRIAAPDAEFDIRREAQIVFERDASEPDGGHVIHTRGLHKVGRPDVVAVCRPDDAEAVAQVLWEIADGMSSGFMPKLPRQGVDVSADLTLWLDGDDGARFEEALGLNNDARVLVREDGSPLVGIGPELA